MVAMPATGERVPGGLGLVRDFLNTLDVETGEDALATPSGVEQWCVRHRLLDAREELGGADRGRFLEVREGLRAVLAAQGRGDVRDAAAALNRVARSCPTVVRFTGRGRVSLEPAAHGIEGAIARLLGVVYSAQASGHWARLKVCQEDTCRWAFYDRSKNHSRAWCSMAVCGNRAKTRSFRRRRGRVSG
jgi:predicted RNA-binding Zn ribbon-like protein